MQKIDQHLALCIHTHTHSVMHYQKSSRAIKVNVQKVVVVNIFYKGEILWLWLVYFSQSQTCVVKAVSIKTTPETFAWDMFNFD